MGRCADGVFVCLRARVVSFLHRVLSFGKTLASLLLPLPLLLLRHVVCLATSFIRAARLVCAGSTVPRSCGSVLVTVTVQSLFQFSLCRSRSLSSVLPVSQTHTHTQTQSQPLR